MMCKLMVRVARDIISEREGIETMVGEYVEVIKKIPRFQPVLFSTPGMGFPKMFPSNKVVYLVKASKPRLMSRKGRVSSAIVMYKGYTGNDVYSAEELGL